MFTAMNSITGSIVFRVDKIIVGAILGTSFVTYYQLPFMIVQMANGFITSVIQFLMPAVSFINSVGDKKKLKDIYTMCTRYVFAISIIIFSGLVLLGKPFLLLWIGKDIAEKSYPLLMIISIVFFFISVSNVGFYFYNGLGKSVINMLSSFVGTASYLIAVLILLPKYQLIGSAIAFCFILVPYPLYIYILNKILEVDFKWYISLFYKAFFLILGVLLISYYLSYNTYDIKFFIFSEFLLFVILILLLFNLSFISKQDMVNLKRTIS